MYLFFLWDLVCFAPYLHGFYPRLPHVSGITQLIHRIETVLSMNEESSVMIERYRSSLTPHLSLACCASHAKEIANGLSSGLWTI